MNQNASDRAEGEYIYSPGGFSKKLWPSRLNLKLNFLDQQKLSNILYIFFFSQKAAKYDSKEIAKDQEDEDEEAI